DRNRSHWSTSKTPSYTKSVSWQHHLIAEELTCLENRKAERMIKHARFRLNTELSNLYYRSGRGLDRALCRSLSQGKWLVLKQNALLTGGTGNDKTNLACALSHNAFRQGY
ncbi:ATP-binding protein, partial [Escherichia coli]|uniref:ATP-binding protein n=5 Tax=Escherichia coli TaxID=562 RepID=UPI001C5F1C7C